MQANDEEKENCDELKMRLWQRPKIPLQHNGKRAATDREKINKWKRHLCSSSCVCVCKLLEYMQWICKCNRITRKRKRRRIRRKSTCKNVHVHSNVQMCAPNVRMPNRRESAKKIFLALHSHWLLVMVKSTKHKIKTNINPVFYGKIKVERCSQILVRVHFTLHRFKVTRYICIYFTTHSFFGGICMCFDFELSSLLLLCVCVLVDGGTV